MDNLGQLLALAARQHHVITTAQAVELGIAPATFHDARRRQGWIRRHRGVWSPPGASESPLTRLSALLLAAGPDAIATGETGLWLHGVVEDPPGRMRLAVPTHASVPRHLDARIIRRDLNREEVSVRNRLRIAPPAACLLDACRPPGLDVRRARDLLIVAVQRRVVDVDEVGDLADASRARGTTVLRRAVLDLGTSGADSPLVHRVHVALREAGLRPDRHPSSVDTGARTLHPDITFAAQRVGIEVDGWRHHSRQRDAAIDDRKDRAYRRAGWDVPRIGWWEFQHGWPGFLRDLRTSLQRDRRVS